MADNVLIHQLNSQKTKQISKKAAGVILAIAVAGVLTGYLLSVKMNSGSKTVISSGSGQPVAKSAGSSDTKTFKDSAEGELQKNENHNEGTHKLIRPGGESQTVYLTSSVLNLDDYVGKKVKVWGETFAAKKAGWLMDVGRVEVL